MICWRKYLRSWIITAIRELLPLKEKADYVELLGVSLLPTLHSPPAENMQVIINHENRVDRIGTLQCFPLVRWSARVLPLTMLLGRTLLLLLFALSFTFAADTPTTEYRSIELTVAAGERSAIPIAEPTAHWSSAVTAERL